MVAELPQREQVKLGELHPTWLPAEAIQNENLEQKVEITEDQLTDFFVLASVNVQMKEQSP